MKKTILVVVILFCLLTGCDEVKTKVTVLDSADKYTQDSSNWKKNHEKDKLLEGQQKEKSKSNFPSLLGETDLTLQIRQMDGDFIKASPYFTSRIVEMLSVIQDQEPSWRDLTVDNYQVTLRFDGYKDIHLNTELNTFWFDGESELYRSNNLESQWSRHIIKATKGELYYDSFEKTIFKQLSEDLTRSSHLDKVTLFYDGDVRLRINRSELPIIKNFPDDEIEFQNIYAPWHHTFELVYLKDSGLLACVHRNAVARGLDTSVYFYTYKDGNIHDLWNNVGKEVIVDLDHLSLEEGVAYLSFSFMDKKEEKLVRLTEEEMNDIINTTKELKDNGEAVDETISYIIWDSNDIKFEDYNHDGIKDLLILSQARTVGARSIFRFHDRVITVFDLSAGIPKCIDILLERDSTEGINPFTYFQEE